MPVKDEVSNRYGRLVVVSRCQTINSKAHWLCLCDCGQTKSVAGDTLRQGLTASCGCYRREAPRLRSSFHGHSSCGVDQPASRTYKSWQEMWARCTRENHVSFPNYGGRGISICKRWESFQVFLSDMGERPAGLSLDRIKGHLNYTPSNCQWSDRKTQNRNRRSVLRVRWKGKTQCLAAWCEEFNIPYPRTYDRLVTRGLTVAQAFRSPIDM